MRYAPECPTTTIGPRGTTSAARPTVASNVASAGHTTAARLPAGASGTMNIAFTRAAANCVARS